MPVSIEGRGRSIRCFGRDLLELHEHQVPDLDEAIAVRVRAAGRAAGNGRPVIVEDLRAGAAGAGLPHGPEVVRGRDANDALFGETGDLAPERVRLVVLGKDRDQEALFPQAVVPRDQTPGELDRTLLEVVAEREVAQHLEEGVVARGVADIVEVVVLAPCTHALLRGGGAAVGPGLGAGEDVLELHHAGIGEHQRRVVARHERARVHDLVLVRGEIVQKLRADFVDARHGAALHGYPGGGRPGAWMRAVLLSVPQAGCPDWCASAPACPGLDRPKRPAHHLPCKPRRRAAPRRHRRGRRGGGSRG